MTHDDFLSIALRVYGDAWAKEISRRLGIKLRTVQRWGSGAREIPDGVSGIMHFWDARL